MNYSNVVALYSITLRTHQTRMNLFEYLNEIAASYIFEDLALPLQHIRKE